MFSMGISARIVKRIITLLIVTLGVVTLSFCLQIFTGTDPAEMLVRKTTLFATEEQIQAMRVELGLDGTLSEQYADYIKGLLTGDLGISITNRKPVIDNIRNALPVTCMLVIMSMLWVAILTVLISAFSVIWKDKAFDHATRVICIIGICVPSFWLALILLIAFAVEIPIFSVISDGSIKSLTGNVIGDAVKEGPGFIHIFLVGGDGNVPLLHHAVGCVGDLVREHGVVFGPVSVQKIPTGRK